MHLIELTRLIRLPNRQRQEFKEATLRDLANSIKKNGLIHTLTVESLDNPVLRAGERRFRAITQFVRDPYKHNGVMIPPHMVPVTLTGELTEEEREEVELAENIDREDLTWHEKNAALARLHALRGAQKQAQGGKQTFIDTAREVSKVEVTETPPASATMAVRNATLLAPFLNDPEVKKAKNEREALSIVRKRLSTEFSARLAQSFDTSKGQNTHTLLHADCRDALRVLPDAVFDVIITDPPYGIDAHKMSPMSQSDSAVQHEYDDSPEYAREVWWRILVEGVRVCKPAAHLYMFFDLRHWQTLNDMARTAGWTVWPYPIVWHKQGGGNLGDSTRGPRRSYETILFAHRGDKRVTGVYLDVIIEATADSFHHAAAKPVNLYLNLLRRSCIPGDHVLDPCAGGGVIFPAANTFRLVATGIESIEAHYNTALRRMNESRADV